jgi:uncharacterized protein with von Willebrand factor type A (vWA) domain
MRLQGVAGRLTISPDGRPPNEGRSMVTTRDRAANHRRRSTGKLNSVPLQDLRAEIRRRERRLATLHRKREKLMEQMETLDREIAEYAAITAAGTATLTKRGSPRKRPRNTVVLVDALKRVLDTRTLTVTEAAGAVQRAGYQTVSDNFRTIVNQALISNRKSFKKIARGRYTLRK